MTTVQIPARLAKRLEQYAKARGQSPQHLAQEALANYLDEEEKRYAAETEAAFREPGSHTSEEVFAGLDAIVHKHERKHRQAA